MGFIHSTLGSTRSVLVTHSYFLQQASYRPCSNQQHLQKQESDSVFLPPPYLDMISGYKRTEEHQCLYPS